LPPSLDAGIRRHDDRDFKKKQYPFQATG